MTTTKTPAKVRTAAKKHARTVLGPGSGIHKENVEAAYVEGWHAARDDLATSPDVRELVAREVDRHQSCRWTAAGWSCGIETMTASEHLSTAMLAALAGAVTGRNVR